MDLNEAYKILGVSAGASEDDVKKKYRELSKKFHPDLAVGANSKEKEVATKKFQEINQAYETIKNPPPENNFSGFSNGNGFGGFGGFGGFNINDVMGFGNIGNNRKKQRRIEEIHIYETLSFKDSVLGTSIKVNYDRNKACDSCSGDGVIYNHSGCKECDGFGKVMRKTQMGVMIGQCGKCKPNSQNCIKCNTLGTIKSNVDVNIKIPGGIHDGNVMRLQSAGNFAGEMMGQIMHSDAFLHLKVTPEPGLSLVNNDVHSTIKISLLDALKGKTEKVKTIIGDVDVDIAKNVKNKDIIEIPKAGVNNVGKHIVNINVEYPDDCSSLIDLLENKKSEVLEFGPDYVS